MKVVEFKNVTSVLLQRIGVQTKLIHIVKDSDLVEHPTDPTLKEKNQMFVIDKIDPLVPVRIKLEESMIFIRPMGWFDMGKSPRKVTVEIHVVLGHGTFLKLKEYKGK